jgi:hypothetical protein
MSNPFYRAQRCRDLAEECRAIAALCAPSTEMRTHYSRMSEHYSSLAEAEELGTWFMAVSRFDNSDRTDGVFAHAAYR